jgi:CBS-domain-containing membrane protein
MKVKVVMKSPVPMVEPGTTVAQAEAMLAYAGTRALPVVEGRRLVGMVQRRDLLRVQPSTVPALARYEWALAPDRLCVGGVMRREVVALAPEADVQEAARLLSGRKAEALPVLDGDDVVGVVGIPELLTVLVKEVERRWPPRLGRVLAAVGAGDGTPPALPAALAIARRHRAQLMVLHVLPPLHRRLAAEVSQSTLDRLVAQRRALAQQWLAASVPQEIEATVNVAEGDEAAEVVATAARDAVDLIVADAATARAIAHEAPCPVLAVPAGGTEHARR